jgi:carboxypeptidase Q
MTLSSLRTATALGLISMSLLGGAAFAKPAPKPAPLASEVQAEILRDAALKSNVAYDFVAELTTRFGARPAGSASEKNAAIWAAEKLKGMGFQNVRVESFPLSVWERGEESIEITSPFPQKLLGTALGQSTASAPEGIEAEAVIFDTYTGFIESKADLTGKIVVILQPMAKTSEGSGYGRMSGTVRSKGWVEAQKRGAVGYVIRSLSTDDHRFPHTGSGGWSDGKGIPSMALSVPDAEALGRIEAMQKAGKAGPLRLKMRTGGKFLGVGTSQNVVADLPGSEHPEQVVILGGHLDSWDLGTGAIDDGAGIAISLAAAKTMIDQKVQPKRTVRVVLWGSEEVAQPEPLAGAGGKAYVEAHKAELANHITANEMDHGAGKTFSAMFMPTEDKAFISSVDKLIYPLGIYIDAKGEPRGGSDTAELHEAGVPAFDLRQDGYDYFDTHHTPDDVLDRIDPAKLTQNVAALTAITWMIADTNVTFTAPKKAP